MSAARFGRFNLVGLLGAALQLALFYLLVRGCRLPETAATAIAVEIAVLHNFLWHERFTWPDRGRARPRQTVIRLLRFHAGNGLVSLAGNTLLTYVLAQRLGFPALPSAVAAIVLCAPANFWLADRWVYVTPAILSPVRSAPKLIGDKIACAPKRSVSFRTESGGAWWRAC